MRELLKKYLSTAAKVWIYSILPSRFFRKVSYSGCGEDILIEFVLRLIHGSRPRKYLDVGANHPFYLSNTALGYLDGGQGILVEPDPYLAELLKKRRPRDTVMQCGVHFSGEAKAEFFVMEPSTLNTLSRSEMERYVAMGHPLKNSLQIELIDINEILRLAGIVDFISLDVEGLDRDILKMIDWEKYRPTCVCVETITYETQKEPRKLNDIIEFMLKQDYILYADTFINSIFVDRRQWSNYWDNQ